MVKKNKSMRKTTRKSSTSRNPPSTAVAYTGPLRDTQEALVTVDLVAGAAVTSDASGVYNQVFADIPNASPDWSNMIATYGEYRVLSMQLRYCPNVLGATQGTFLYAPFYVVWDATSTVTPLASYAAAENYATLRPHSFNQPWTISHRMKGLEESTFAQVTSGTIDYSFKVYATGLTPSTSYGRMIITWRAQFRGRM